MNFIQWLNSLDELLYELMGWFIFFPITLWRILGRPVETMRYAENQLLLPQESQYRETVTPPVMLILAILLSQAIGLAVGGMSPIVADRRGLANLISDNTTLLLLRLVLFGLFPIVLAARKVRAGGIPLDRDTLKPPFYAQCYAAAVFSLLLGIGVAMTSVPVAELPLFGTVIALASFLLFCVTQVRWFRQELKLSVPVAILHVSLGIGTSMAMFIAAGYLFAS